MTREGRLAFQSVWKQFRKGERADSLRDLVPEAVRSLLPGSAKERDDSAFWAVHDVSFEVGPGRVLGIVGPNGAGKSTILKLATGILEPSRGTVDVRGRIGALIEVAAGFHPDLTGRENIFLQGAVMGMTREAVTRRLDEIVAFSGIEEFLDTPVKRYSSGMHARLGFAIAAHLDPDVLLIDEVLSVGDLAFQRRAVARLDEIVAREIPIVIVSHHLDRIIRLCDEAILLVGGRIVRRGEPLGVVTAYVEGEGQPAPDGVGWVAVDGDSLVPGSELRSGASLSLVLRGAVLQPDVGVGLRVRSVPEGKILFSTFSASCGVRIDVGAPFEVGVTLDMNLGPGLYGLQPFLVRESKLSEIWRGENLLVRVEREAATYGIVDLNARMRLMP
jgi:ABC-type polysaccharide/polyol phosphate transport system ATPase subunit